MARATKRAFPERYATQKAGFDPGPLSVWSCCSDMRRAFRRQARHSERGVELARIAGIDDDLLQRVADL
ncbi:hypothetical protein BRN55_12560, partial [Xanthomonas oryzae pv. oryzae]